MCTFCDIAAERSPAHLVLSDESFVAFLDVRPLFAGHTLLVPRDHYETLTDLPVSLVGPYFERARLLARAVELACEAEGTFVAINNKISQSVPHLHVHIVPRKRKDGLRGFFWPRTNYPDDDEMGRVAEAVRSRAAELAATEA